MFGYRYVVKDAIGNYVPQKGKRNKLATATINTKVQKLAAQKL